MNEVPFTHVKLCLGELIGSGGGCNRQVNREPSKIELKYRGGRLRTSQSASVSFESQGRIFAGPGSGKIQKEHGGRVIREVKGMLQIGGCGSEVAPVE